MRITFKISITTTTTTTTDSQEKHEKLKTIVQQQFLSAPQNIKPDIQCTQFSEGFFKYLLIQNVKASVL